MTDIGESFVEPFKVQAEQVEPGLYVVSTSGGQKKNYFQRSPRYKKGWEVVAGARAKIIKCAKVKSEISDVPQLNQGIVHSINNFKTSIENIGPVPEDQQEVDITLPKLGITISVEPGKDLVVKELEDQSAQSDVSESDSDDSLSL